MFSLNATRKRNAVSPSCASGRPSKLAVSAGSSGVWVSGPGPSTMCAATTERARPCDVQTAPSASQSSAGARVIDSASRLSGVTVIDHTPLSPSTRAAPVTAPPATVRTRVRMASGVTATASLNARRKLNAVSPSCASGSPSNAAVSGFATLPADEPPAAAVTVISAVFSSGWTSYRCSLSGLSGYRGYDITSTVTALSGSGPPPSFTVSRTSGIVSFPSPKWTCWCQSPPRPRPSGGSMSSVSLIRTIAIIGPWGWSRHSVKRSGSPSATEPVTAWIQTVCRPVAVPKTATAALVPPSVSTERTWNS